MADKPSNVFKERPKDYTCSFCVQILNNPGCLQCGHRQCESCLKSSSTRTMTCPLCQCMSLRSEITDDEGLKQEIERSKIHCTDCDWSGKSNKYEEHLHKRHQPQTIMSANPSQRTSTDVQANPVQCPLHICGCVSTFLPSQLSEHYSSDIHMKSILSLISLHKLNHESDELNHSINLSNDSPSSLSDNYLPFIEQLTTLLDKTLQPFNPEVPNSKALPDINISSDSIYMLTRNLIQEFDRDPNRNFNRQSIGDQTQLNELMMSLISNQIDPLYDSDSAYHRTEEDQDPPPINEDNNIQPCADDQQQTCLCKHLGYSNDLLQAGLQNKSVSTDGILVWRIDGINGKIKNAISKRELHINSPIFPTSISGHQLWARVYLNGRDNPKFISLYVYLSYPAHSAFLGHIKFTLVDQSKNHPLEHIVKHCSGKIDNVGDYIGCDDFTDKNDLQMEGNRFICDDSAYFLISVEQTNQEKFANLPANVQHALIQT